ncbi:PEP-CTERM protein-sorting domain-containing protein [Terrimicrobium sacchariphilum]|uniref:PEP-CTERM protein-sorting domain-containing protein n=1 Tax=Terrimicrobium sacchariphilum TaxID=690879 RepID=A0A146G5Z6_TERSA|nr:autotransporter-associated beta strand repeat-containing protein [Terrimicrobium sacchariphilum]GAT32228.1 PEP-CTERM protein-sorting domain-containing protein [Terrimicrobium sacchariphilum]
MTTKSHFPRFARVNQLHSAIVERISKGVLLACLPLGLVAQAQATEIQKANNSNALNLTSSWVGGVVPGASDIALFDSTMTSTRYTAIGGNVSFGGIKVTNLGSEQYLNATAGAAMTLGSSGIDMSAATANLTIGAVMDLSASQTWTVASGRTLSLGGASVGAGTITLTGSGTYSFTGTSTVTSGTFVSGPLGLGTVNLENGIHLSATNSRVIANAVNLNGNISVDMASTNLLTFSGGMNVGSGTRTITISNTNGSATSPSLAFGGGLGSTYSQVTGSGVLVFKNGNASETPMVSVRLGSGSTNDYTVISSDITIGSGVSLITTLSNTLTASSDVTVETGGILNLSNNGGSSASQTIGSLSGGGMVFNGTTNTTGTPLATLTIDGGTSVSRTTFSGVIQNGTLGNVAVVKTGSNTQVFSGANTYLGATTINGGTLLIDGTHIQAQAPAAGLNIVSSYVVNSGGTLGGTGRISMFNTTANKNAVAVATGGTLAPGDGGTGTLTLDGANFSGSGSRVLNMASGAKFSFDLAGDGTSADQVAFWNYVNGDLGLNSNVINLSITGPLVEGTYTVSLFKFYSDSGTTLTTSGITSGLTIGTLDSSFQGTPTLTYNSAGGTIDLTYTVVPEPSTWALVALGLTSILVLRRRKAC